MWESVIPMVVGTILSLLASFIDRLPANAKSIVISFIAFAVAGVFYFTVPELQELSFKEVLAWAMTAVGSATATYALFIKHAKKLAGKKK